jgi:hypothetical protein
MTLLAGGGAAAFAMVIGLALLVTFVVYAIGTGVASHRNTRLRELARNYDGEVEPASWFTLPRMTFRHGDRIVTLFYTHGGGRDHKYKTHLSIVWPHINLRCEIFPTSVFSGLRKLIGMQDIEIGSPEFDEPFVITGNDEEAIKKFLTLDAQQSLLQLAQLNSGFIFGGQDFYLSISRGGLTITKWGYISERYILDPFIRLFLRFFDASQPAISGIEFLSSPAAHDQAEPHCIVCGELLRSEVVSCRNCRTPHHKDCWQYFGGCATYACGGKQFVPAKASGGR